MRTGSQIRNWSRLGQVLLIAGALTAGGCLYADAGIAFGPPVPIASVQIQAGWTYTQVGGVWYYVPQRYVVYEQGRGRGRGRGYWRDHRRPNHGYMLRGGAWVVIR
jgi:hypothetical protein